MIITINSILDLKKDKVQNDLRNKIKFTLFTILAKINKDESVIRTLFIRNKIINEKSYMSFIIMNKEFEIVYETNPLVCFTNIKGCYKVKSCRMEFINDKIINNIYTSNKIVNLKELCTMYNLDLVMDFNSIKYLIFKKKLTLNELIMYNKFRNRDLVKINLSNEDCLFCLTNVIF